MSVPGSASPPGPSWHERWGGKYVPESCGGGILRSQKGGVGDQRHVVERLYIYVQL